MYVRPHSALRTLQLWQLEETSPSSDAEPKVGKPRATSKTNAYIDLGL